MDKNYSVFKKGLKEFLLKHNKCKIDKTRSLALRKGLPGIIRDLYSIQRCCEKHRVLIFTRGWAT